MALRAIKKPTNKADIITGTNANNSINGLGGNDRLSGAGGNDTLIGGKGADRLTGGAGRDVFRYLSLADSAALVGAFSPKTGDTITDFKPGTDRLNLLGLGKDLLFNGTTALAKGVWTELVGTYTLVKADVTGDAIADFAIRLVGAKTLLVSDFVSMAATKPTISSADLLVVDENSGIWNPIYQATSPDAVSWSLGGGPDDGLFSIDSVTGALSFTANPDYEMPGDAGSDNVYNVVIKATNAWGGTETEDLAITVNDVSGDPASVIDLEALGKKTGIVIQGARSGDKSGYSVSSAGDVNGDGFSDLIIGAPFADPSGRIQAGISYILLGLALPEGNVDLSKSIIGRGIAIFGGHFNDRAGTSVSAAGDVNGDGFDDVIIGATGATSGGKYDAGAAYVIFGSAIPVGPVDLGNLPASRGFALLGAYNYDYTGGSVSTAGDINGDGFDDLLIGVAEASPGDLYHAGSTYVVFGSANPVGPINLANLDAKKGFVIHGVAEEDESGKTAASCGDFNGDGIDDMIIGAAFAYGPGPNSGYNSGAAYVVFGSTNPFQSLYLADISNYGIRIFGGLPDDLAGSSVSSGGDVNGDGFDDAIIGAPGVDVGAYGEDFGASYVVFGSANPSSSVNLANLGTSGFTIVGSAQSDYAVMSVASAGDVNGDGFADLIVGVSFADKELDSNQGTSYLIFGSADLSGTINLGNLNVENGIVIQGANTHDYAGGDVSAAGDMNGDGFDDIIVGASGANPNGRSDAGASYIIYGQAFGKASTAYNLAASDGADRLIGGWADDIITGIGKDDAARGGRGKDVLEVSGATFQDIDGGNGIDRLKITGASDVFDFGQLRSKVTSIEELDLTAAGNQTVKLSKLSLLHLSDNTSGGVTSLTVFGSSGDLVDLTDDLNIADATGWVKQAGTQTIDTDVFNIWKFGNARILVDADMTVM